MVKSGYFTSDEKVPVFRLPSDPDEYLQWLEVLKKVNKDLNVTDLLVRLVRLCSIEGWPDQWRTQV